MKKTFLLSAPGLKDPRVRDKIRRDVNRYVRRERRKKLPDGFDFWELACRVGLSSDMASPLEVSEINQAIEDVAASGATAVYIEIVATAGKRAPR